MKIFFVFAAIFLFNCHIYSQALRDTSGIGMTNFQSHFEEDTFNDLKSNKINYTALFVALSENEDKNTACQIDHIIQNLYEELIKDGYQKKTIRKLTDKVYNEVHKRFLKQFKLQSDFIDIFKSGEYNCLTATALYAIVLNKFNIPFTIKEKPTHVYLIVDPEKSNIVLEATNPQTGVFQFSDMYKESYVKYLLASKLITAVDRGRSGTDELFNKFYYTDKGIDLIQLAGLHYCNKGIRFFLTSDYEKSYIQFEKAFYLYPEQKCKFLFTACMASILVAASSKPNQMLTTAPYLSKCANLYSSEEADRFVTNYFKDLSYQLTVTTPDLTSYSEYYKKLISSIIRPDIIHKITSIYNSHCAHYYYYKGQYQSAFDYEINSYYENPNDLEIKSKLEECILQKLNTLGDNISISDTLESICERYPFLEEGRKIRQIRLSVSLLRATDSYMNDQKILGDQLLDRFEQYAKKYNLTNFNSQQIGRAFGEASAYHVRNHKYKLARNYLDRGFQYAPNSSELKRKLKYLDEMPK